MREPVALRTQVREQMQATRAIGEVIAGRPDRDVYIRYLLNVYGYAQHSPIVIAQAGARVMNSHPELGRYLLHHAEEEQGHHLWAMRDLTELGVSEQEVLRSVPNKACRAMVGVIYYTAAHANPVGLFGWLYVLEAMGEDLGGAMAGLLDEGLGLKGQALRFVAGHGENDIDHTHDLVDRMSRHISEPRDIAAVEQVGELVADLYVRMFRHIGGETA